MGTVVNCTISHAPVTFVQVTGGANPTWYVVHVGGNKRPAPMPLVNGHHFFLYHLIGLHREEKFTGTLEYTHQYQATSDPNAWIFRYEHIKQPPPGYEFPLSHTHVDACPASYSGAKPFPALHMPTGRRVTIEIVIRHLIAEHGLQPISDQWEKVVEESEAHFREIQRKRFSSDAG